MLQFEVQSMKKANIAYLPYVQSTGSIACVFIRYQVSSCFRRPKKGKVFFSNVLGNVCYSLEQRIRKEPDFCHAANLKQFASRAGNPYQNPFDCKLNF